MKNKNLIILIIGILIAILGAFLVIEISFSPKSFNSLTKPSKDVFLDVDTFNVDEYNEENNEDKEDKEESVEDGIDVETEVDENREYLYEEYEPVLEKDGEYISYSDYETALEVINPVIFDEMEKVEDSNSYNSNVIDNKELLFLSNLTSLADSYTDIYHETMTYVLDNNIDLLKEFVDEKYPYIYDEFNKLDCNENPDLEKIKEDYLNGIKSANDGFNAYINNPQSEDGNQSFYDSDDYFLNGQYKLDKYLKSLY